MSDLISRAELLESLKYEITDGFGNYNLIRNWQEIYKAIDMAIEALTEQPQLFKEAYEQGKYDAAIEPIVIKCKMAFSKEDFKKWAEDIKKQDENIIVIPYDAEVVSTNTPTENTNTSTNTPTDLISRANAIKAVCNAMCESDVPYYPQCDQAKYCEEIQALLNVPSVSANSDDLIIKNGKGIQDGLYNIKDGEIFAYKAKGGTVRAYKLVPSVSAEPMR